MITPTPSQLGTIKDLKGMKIALHFLGVEEGTENPVLWIKDQRRKFPMVIGPDGAGYDPRNRIRELTEEEMLEMDEQASSIILTIPMVSEITPDLLEEQQL